MNSWSFSECETTKIKLAKTIKNGFLSKNAEAVARRCSVKKVFLEIWQNSQESNCARDSFLIKLQASGMQLY